MKFFGWLFIFLDRQQFCTWWCAWLSVVVWPVEGMMQYKESLIQQQNCHWQNWSGTFDLQLQFIAHLIIKTHVLKLQFYSMVYLEKEKSYFFPEKVALQLLFISMSELSLLYRLHYILMCAVWRGRTSVHLLLLVHTHIHMLTFSHNLGG